MTINGVRVKAATELLAPPGDVWALLAEPRHLSDWWPGYRAIRPDRRGLEVGARWEVVRSQEGLLRRPGEEGLIAITAAEQNRRLAWQDVQQRFTATVDLEGDGGQTRATRDRRGALVSNAARGAQARPTGSAHSAACPLPDCCGAQLMFDLRYHVASLAAVFVALLIGILVGVGLTGKVDDAEKNELRRRAGAAESQLQSINEQQATARRESNALRRLGTLGYPLLMEDRLRERRVALLFVGPVDETVQASVTTALEDAGARGLTRMRALKLPVDPGRIDSALAGQANLTRYQGPERLRELGRLLGHEFVVGGDAEAWDELSSDLVIGQSGRARPPVEGVVVVRTVDPQTGDTARFLRGLYEGLADTGVPQSVSRRRLTTPLRSRCSIAPDCRASTTSRQLRVERLWRSCLRAASRGATA